MVKIYNQDCMTAMKQMKDKYFDLAIVDPPYGIGEDGKSNHSRSKFAVSKKYTPKSWDKEPASVEYFEELRRVSKNQIIWGANHFISRIPFDSSCWIVWDKVNGATDFADAELAWTSFRSAVRIFRFKWHGCQQGAPHDGSIMQGNKKLNEKRIHPTQKPVRLYKWLLSKYAKEGDKILDTHLGSGSSAIAAYELGHDFTGYEIDFEYYNAAKERIDHHMSQGRLFE
jgi:site-specific DNA-methyltransferase (adenine-specific)